MEFFISSPWTWSRDLGGLFILTKIIRHSVTHMNTSFLIYEDSYIYKADESREWPGQSIDSHWESPRSPSVPEWMASTESALEASSFNKVAGCTHLSSKQKGLPIRPGHTSPALWKTLTDSYLWLVFLHGDLHPCYDIAIDWYGYLALSLSQTICFFSVWWNFGGVLLISNRLTNHLFR